MPRRIIYIQNPSSGSHFRTLDRSGGGSHYTPRPRAPRAPTAPRTPRAPTTPPVFDNDVGDQNGYLPGYTPPANWWIHNAKPTPPNYGSYNGPGVGPYNTQFTPAFEQASTLLGELYDIAQGIDPYTGNTLPPYGTPGTLKYGVGSPGFDLTIEAIGRDAGRHSLTFGGPFAQIPSRYTVRSPKRNQPRPWWAK
jgi:hypothetical protein